MAMIHCPECATPLSDKASVCPVCGYPVLQRNPAGNVKIKLSALGSVYQKVTIYKEEVLPPNTRVWEGFTGETAEIMLREPTIIRIVYRRRILPHRRGTFCDFVISPVNGKQYQVVPLRGFLATRIFLQAVDVLTPD